MPFWMSEGFFFFVFLCVFFPAVSMPTSLAEAAPVGLCQDLAGFIDALWWLLHAHAWKRAAPACVTPERKVHLWTMACFHHSASPQIAADDGSAYRAAASARLSRQTAVHNCTECVKEALIPEQSCVKSTASERSGACFFSSSPKTQV